MELDSIKTLGLNETETKVYLTILGNENLTASEVQRLCSLSKATVYLALKKLKAINLITETGNNPRRFSVTGVKPILQLKEEIMNKVEEETSKVVELVNEQLNKRKHFCQETRNKVVIGGLFFGKEKTIHKLVELIREAKKEVYLSSLPIWLLMKLKPHLEEVERERGVTVKIAVSDETFIPKQLRKLQMFQFTYFLPKQTAFLVNGEKFNNGQVFVDRYLFANVYFKGEELILEYIKSPRCTNCVLNFIQKIAEINRKNPELQYITSREAILVKQALKEGCRSKRELSLETGLSGKKVNEAISHLLKEGAITLKNKKGYVGRPKTIACLIKADET